MTKPEGYTQQRDIIEQVQALVGRVLSEQELVIMWKMYELGYPARTIADKLK